MDEDLRLSLVGLRATCRIILARWKVLSHSELMWLNAGLVHKLQLLYERLLASGRSDTDLLAFWEQVGTGFDAMKPANANFFGTVESVAEDRITVLLLTLGTVTAPKARVLIHDTAWVTAQACYALLGEVE